jgi:Protein of unknown function DUF262
LRQSFSGTPLRLPQRKRILIDTILNDRPIPLLLFQRSTSAQKGVPSYTVIDGQQRLRAIFEFLEDRFRLSQSNKSSYYNNGFPIWPTPFEIRFETMIDRRRTIRVLRQRHPRHVRSDKSLRSSVISARASSCKGLWTISRFRRENGWAKLSPSAGARLADFDKRTRVKEPAGDT